MKGRPTILNSKGEPVILNSLEAFLAEDLQQKNQKLFNALGYEIDITTLTTIVKKVTEQRFYQIPPADYMPIRVGEGAWATNLLTYVSFQTGGDFEEGILNTGANDSRLATTDAGVEGISVKVFPWAKENNWSLIDLNTAARSGNWDLIAAKETSRKKNFDLGIQKIAFLGSNYDTNILGLLTQSDVTTNTTTITENISGMSAAEINALVAAIIEDYHANAQYTVYPTHFIMPQSDYNGMAAYPDATYPLKMKLDILLEAFQRITMNKNFKILPLVYANEDNADNVAIIGGYNMYVLLNYDDTSVRMDVPVPYTATQANSINNFQFRNVGYAQFTGCKAYRPREILYFAWQT